MDHADAGRDRILGAVDLALLAVDPDDPPIGLVEAVEDVHQRRLAGAVLADDAVDRAGGDPQIDAPVGVDRPEALVDADQLDRRRPLAAAARPAPVGAAASLMGRRARLTGSSSSR